MPEGCSLNNEFLCQPNQKAIELLKLVSSENTIETAVGIATANALTRDESAAFTSGDVLERIRLNEDDRVGMIGHFKPIVEPIQKKTRQLIVFEQTNLPYGNILPSSEIENRLPECTVAFITAATIINHTFDHVIQFAQNCREVILLGASTPLIPEAFSNTPVSLLSGVIVDNTMETLRIVSSGGGVKAFKPFIKKMNIRV